MEKYRMLYILLYSSILALLVFLIVWLYRINRRESRRRIHAQTRLLIQNRLVAQRDEFDNVFHSIRDGVITYDTDFRIHFTNRSLLKMLHLPKDEAARPYEGLPAGSIFKIYNNGKEILRPMLKQVVTEESSVVIPENSFMQEVHSGSYFRFQERLFLSVHMEKLREWLSLPVIYRMKRCRSVFQYGGRREFYLPLAI